MRPGSAEDAESAAAAADSETEDAMRKLLELMRESKPGDRSEMDRKWAVSIRKFEEALAVFLYQVKGGG